MHHDPVLRLSVMVSVLCLYVSGGFVIMIGTKSDRAGSHQLRKKGQDN